MIAGLVGACPDGLGFDIVFVLFFVVRGIHAKGMPPNHKGSPFTSNTP
jgi:hypothetical protein